MIKEYANKIALQSDVKLSGVILVPGAKLGCVDFDLLYISSGGQQISTLVYQTDVSALDDNVQAERLRKNIQDAVSRLKRLLQP